MERRAEARFPADKSIKVIILSQPELSQPEWHVDGVIADVSGLGMRVVLPRALPLDAAIRFDLDDTLFLGEVCYCEPHEGGFAVGIRLCHSLIGLDQLAKLRSRFLHDRSPVALT